MAEIVITEFMDESAVEDLKRDFSVHYDPGLVDAPAEMAKLGASARALIVRNRTQVRGPFLQGCGALEAVGRLGVGLDNIDLDACKARRIAVLPATGANTLSVAEYVIAAIFLGVRGVWHANDAVLAGQWPRNGLMLGEASGRNLGLVGFGEIARAVADRARPLGMTVAASDPLLGDDDPAWARHGVRKMPFDALLGWSDVISLHTPLLPATRGLINAGALARMKPGAVLINTARGGIVDEPALVGALRAGHLGKAVLDVMEAEPLPAGSIFSGVPNLYLTPHIAGVTLEGNVRVSSQTAENVRRALQAGR